MSQGNLAERSRSISIDLMKELTFPTRAECVRVFHSELCGPAADTPAVSEVKGSAAAGPEDGLEEFVQLAFACTAIMLILVWKAFYD